MVTETRGLTLEAEVAIAEVEAVTEASEEEAEVVTEVATPTLEETLIIMEAHLLADATTTGDLLCIIN